MDQTRQHCIWQHSKNQVSAQLVTSRFPEFEVRIIIAFERYASFRDACGDYQEICMCLQKVEREANSKKKGDLVLLKSMKIELEQELFRHFRKVRLDNESSNQK